MTCVVFSPSSCGAVGTGGMHLGGSGFPRCFALQMSCVIQPIGQKLHHVRGRYSAMTMSPITAEVSMRL